LRPSRRIVVVASDHVGSRMAGPGIRSLNFARELRAEGYVTLVVPFETDLVPDGFDLVVANVWDASEMNRLTGGADCVVAQRLPVPTMRSLARTRTRRIYDLSAPLGIEKFKDWIDPTVNFPTLVHADFDYPKALISVTIAVLGIGIAAYFWFRREEDGPLHGLTQRNALARAGYTFLEKKYYLDVLYENIVVAGIKGPIARGAYWFDQHVIDKFVNGVGSGAKKAGRVTYDLIDQKVVDGAVNEIAEVTGETGGLLRYLQSGRVQRYALLLFAAVGLLSLALLIFNI